MRTAGGPFCAWCYASIGADDPAIGVFAILSGSGPRVPGMITIQIDGRFVPGRIREPGSAAAMEGTDIGFKLCGRPCADDLTAAIGRDRALRIVH